jgi:hypothetical protein
MKNHICTKQGFWLEAGPCHFGITPDLRADFTKDRMVSAR